MFDRVPFAGSGWVVCQGNFEIMRVGKAVLQEVFPCMRTAAIAASAVGEDDQFGGLGIACLAFGFPPLRNALGGELRHIVGFPDKEAAGVGGHIVNPVGNGRALSIGGEVVIVDQFGRISPLRVRVAEASNQFLFLGVNADDRDILMSISGTQFGNVLELNIAQGMIGSSQFLLVNQQGKATLDHQACGR